MKYLKYFFHTLNKKMKIGVNLKAGRNFSGAICVHHRFGGNKMKKYSIDWYRRIESFGYLYKILIDFNRTAFLGSIIYENGLFSNIILSENIKIGQKIYSGSFNEDHINGYTSVLKNIKLFTILNNIELYPRKGFSLSRSAGANSLLTGINNNKKISTLKLKSGFNMFIPSKSLASFGLSSNVSHKFNDLKKAGKSWSLGKRPSVRGVAMNPCDHPHGGGEGKKSPPKAQRSPWGWLTKGTSSIKKKYKKIMKIYRKVKGK